MPNKKRALQHKPLDVEGRIESAKILNHSFGGVDVLVVKVVVVVVIISRPDALHVLEISDLGQFLPAVTIRHLGSIGVALIIVVARAAYGWTLCTFSTGMPLS